MIKAIFTLDFAKISFLAFNRIIKFAKCQKKSVKTA